jgi:hypothetical protein
MAPHRISTLARNRASRQDFQAPMRRSARVLLSINSRNLVAIVSTPPRVCAYCAINVVICHQTSGSFARESAARNSLISVKKLTVTLGVLTEDFSVFRSLFYAGLETQTLA